MQLTDNFTLEELIRSTTADKFKIDNTPDDYVKDNLKRLCEDVLQPIRDKYGKPITVTSGYRSTELNKKVNGSNTSQHKVGAAADIKASDKDNAYLFNLIKDMIKKKEIKVGQLIWEYGSKTNPKWVHVSLPYSKTNQILYFYSK